MSEETKDEQRQKLRDAFEQDLTDAYVCGRVWSAWQYGTMSEDDFQPASECEEVLDSLIESALEIKEETAQLEQLADILTRTANALKGPPDELASHSWHDLPEIAKKLKDGKQ